MLQGVLQEFYVFCELKGEIMAMLTTQTHQVLEQQAFAETKRIFEVRFGVQGKTFPADEGYRLLGSICKSFSQLHEIPNLAINTISGTPDCQGKIQLESWSKLSLRCPLESLPLVLALAGTKLEVGGCSIQLGNAEVAPLKPAQQLKARLVVIKHPSGNFSDVTPEWFLEACDRQLKALGIEAEVGIPADEAGEPARKSMTVKGKAIVGYSVIVADLLPEDSLTLQAQGLGGKKRMGCGYFVPYRLL